VYILHTGLVFRKSGIPYIVPTGYSQQSRSREDYASDDHHNDACHFFYMTNLYQYDSGASFMSVDFPIIVCLLIITNSAVYGSKALHSNSSPSYAER
jgi:hypothetical protein